MSKITSLCGSWRNVNDYNIIYTDDFSSLKLEILINDRYYSMNIKYDIFRLLDGSDEIILHKNVMDLFAIHQFMLDNRKDEICEYLKLMFENPYDLKSIENALLKMKEGNKKQE